MVDGGRRNRGTMRGCEEEVIYFIVVCHGFSTLIFSTFVFYKLLFLFLNLPWTNPVFNRLFQANEVEEATFMAMQQLVGILFLLLCSSFYILGLKISLDL